MLLGYGKKSGGFEQAEEKMMNMTSISGWHHHD